MQKSTKYHLTIQGIRYCQGSGIPFSPVYLLCSSLVGGRTDSSATSMPTKSSAAILHIGTYNSHLEIQTGSLHCPAFTLMPPNVDVWKGDILLII